MRKDQEYYEQFVEDWQDEYGPKPKEFVPDADSSDFKAWREEQLRSDSKFERMYLASEKEYNDNYSSGGYCHEQSFKWGFQEGSEWKEKETIEKACEYLENCTMMTEDEVEKFRYFMENY